MNVCMHTAYVHVCIRIVYVYAYAYAYAYVYVCVYVYVYVYDCICICMHTAAGLRHHGSPENDGLAPRPEVLEPLPDGPTSWR